MAQHGIQVNRSGGDRLRFQLYRVPRDRKSTEAAITSLKLIVGPGDDGEPVPTISCPTRTDHAGLPAPSPGRLG